MNYPTEEEEFELMYGDDMELLDDTEMDELQFNCKPSTSKSALINLSQPKTPVRTIDNVINLDIAVNDYPKQYNTPASSNFPSKNVDSPALSQILSLSRPGSALSVRSRELKKVSSTPYTSYKTMPNAINELNNFGLSDGSRKRRLNDIFGDIRDIDEMSDICNEEYINTKRVKTDEERDFELIDKILEARKTYQQSVNPLQKNDVEKLKALRHYKLQNLSYSTPKWPFIVITRSDEERIYVRFHSKEFEDDQLKEIKLREHEHESLLGEAKEHTWNIARELILKNTTNSNNDDVIQEQIISNTVLNDCLWVDKYKPKKYVELLSDESTNRSLLRWLKMWDKVVFGRENKKIDKNAKSEYNTFNKKTGKFEAHGWRRKNKSQLNTEYDELNRPIQKIALLSGPPGLGKTTLAHTIARHAGYVVREMNASDDRSPDAFRLMLENCTQMKSVLNEDKKPNCIILDEIDGAPQQSIEFLVRFVQDNVTEKSKKKGNKNKFVLKRPIICICNDIYVAALRPLKNIAFVVNFPPLESSRLAERLLAIANKEHLDTNLTALLALAEKTGNDVRSCISMLQFYNGNNKPLTLIDVLHSNIGQKDRQKSLFAVWSSIFQISRARNVLLNTPDGNGGQKQHVGLSDTSSSRRMQTVLESVSMGGDFDRLMQGVYENYLNQKMPDPYMKGVVEALEWFTFTDKVQSLINRQQNYSVYPYLPFGFVAWHFLFATMAWPKINFPTKSYEVFQKATTLKMILTALRKGINPSCKGVGEGITVLLDTIPFIKYVICPNMRSVSLQLLTVKEKSDLTHTVDVMSDLGIIYTQIKSVDGSYQYQMEPDLEFVSVFPDIQSPQLNYWGKQLIAREVELEHVRRAVQQTNKPSNTKTKIPLFDTEKIRSKAKSAQNVPLNLPNHLRTLKPKSIQKESVKEQVSKDFFGRMVTKPAPTPSQTVAINANSIVKSPIWYRYKEGFNNAVKKDVSISDLL